MNPQELPLEPLIAPAPVSIWPLAPIWWILIALVIAFIIFTILFFIKKKPKQQTITHSTPNYKLHITEEAISKLSQFKKPYNQNAGPWLQQINQLLKQLCIGFYPNENSHTLLGTDWLDFLNAKCPDANIKKYPILAEGLYRDQLKLDGPTIDGLHNAIRVWIINHV